MQEARTVAEQGAAHAPDGTLIWALAQTDGKGRRGHRWHSPQGNFYASLISRPDVAVPKAAQLGFVTGCAVFDALGEVCEPGFHCQLKWPNDILIDGAKIGGLVLEAKSDAGKPVDYVIIGLGVNLCAHPTDTPYPATDLAAKGQTVSATTFLEAFCRHFLVWSKRWREAGFAPIRDQWKNRAKGLGQEIIVRLVDKELHGTFKDIGADGNLILTSDGADIIVPTGEVYFPSVHSEKH